MEGKEAAIRYIKSLSPTGILWRTEGTQGTVPQSCPTKRAKKHLFLIVRRLLPGC